MTGWDRTFSSPFTLHVHLVFTSTILHRNSMYTTLTITCTSTVLWSGLWRSLPVCLLSMRTCTWTTYRYIHRYIHRYSKFAILVFGARSGSSRINTSQLHIGYVCSIHDMLGAYQNTLNVLVTLSSDPNPPPSLKFMIGSSFSLNSAISWIKQSY